MRVMIKASAICCWILLSFSAQADNISTIQQIGIDQSVQASQEGNEHWLYTKQVGADNSINITQKSSGNIAHIEQFGSGHSAWVNQQSMDNNITIYQYNDPKKINIQQSGGETLIVTQY